VNGPVVVEDVLLLLVEDDVDDVDVEDVDVELVEDDDVDDEEDVEDEEVEDDVDVEKGKQQSQLKKLHSQSTR
jgi:hypothetical protein